MTTARMLRVLAPGLIVASLAPLPMTAQTPPTISIDDVVVLEGNGGTTDMIFTVKLSAPSSNVVQMNYITQPGTATAGVLSTDFSSVGPITLPDSGPASAYPVIVNVSGMAGPTEDIIVSLDGLTHASPGDLNFLLVAPDGRRFVPMAGAGGNVAVSNLTVSMHDSGQLMSASGPLLPGTVGPTAFNPTATFPSPAPPPPYQFPRPAGWATFERAARRGFSSGAWEMYINDDRAGGGPGTLGGVRIGIAVSDPSKDVVMRAGQAVFQPGTTSQQIVVTVIPDTTVEGHETFRVNLLAPVGASIADGQADGRILNDDGGTLPTAVDDAYTILANGTVVRSGLTGLLVNDLPNNGGQLSAQLQYGPSNGTLQLRSDGGFLYQPNAGFVGTDSFTYFAFNNAGASNVATVTITVTPSTTLSPPVLRVGDDRPHRLIMREGLFYEPRVKHHVIAGGVVPYQPLASINTDHPYPIATLENLPQGSFYVWAHVVDVNDNMSGPSNAVVIHNTTGIAPSPPENVLFNVNGSNLDIAWRRGYLGGISTNTMLNATGSATASIPLGDTQTVSFAGLPSGTFNLTLASTNPGGSSPAANVGSVTIPGACAGPPLTVENFLLYVEGLTLGARWDLPKSGTAPTGYVLNVTSPIFNGPVTVRTTNVRVDVPAGVYTMTVTPFNSCGSGPPTPLQSVDKR